MNQIPIPFYTETYPSLHEVVVVEVLEFNDVSVSCKMCEYADYPAMLPTSEMKVRRGKRVSDYVKVGKQMAAQIIRIEEVNGEKQFDLSLKQVPEEESKDIFDYFFKMQKVIQIVSTASKYKHQATLELLSSIWNIVEEKEIEHPYLYLESILIGETVCENKELLDAIQLRMNMPSYTAEKEVILQSLASNGVEVISKKLDEISSTPNTKVFVVAAPKYKIQCTANSKAKAQELLESIVV